MSVRICVYVYPYLPYIVLTGRSLEHRGEPPLAHEMKLTAPLGSSGRLVYILYSIYFAFFGASALASETGFRLKMCRRIPSCHRLHVVTRYSLIINQVLKKIKILP